MEIEELKNKLRKKISEIWKIEMLAKECFSFSFYLNQPNTDEEKQYLRKSREFNFLAGILWRMSVIELSKLFRYREDKNYKKIKDKFNIQLLVQNIKKEGEFGKIGISNKSIINWETELLNNDDSIENITFLRDKIYAHTDEINEQFWTRDLSFNDIQKLIILAESIINEIYREVFNTEIDLSTPVFDRTHFDLIQILAQDKNKKFNLLKRDLGLS